MELVSPFVQHLDTNFIPTSTEIDEIQHLIDGRQVVLEAIDAQIAELQRRRETHEQYIKKHGDLISPARRLHSDILSTIFLTLVRISDDHPPSHPAVTVSHVCRQWRDLALDSPLLWVDIAIRIPPYAKYLFGGVPSHLSVEEQAEYILSSIWAWKWRVKRLTERVETFVKRSKGCPLQILYIARDPPGYEIMLDMEESMGLGSGGGWRDALEPMSRLRKAGNNEWRSLHMDLKMCAAGSLLVVPLRIAVEGRPHGLDNLELNIAYNGATTATSMWEHGLPEGKMNLQPMPLTSLTARMPYSDLCRIQAHWERLTTLSIGSPDKLVVFGPEHAAGVLILTPNLIHCTIAFAAGIPPAPFVTAGQVLPLRKLKTLTMSGPSVPVEFAALLQLPSLTHLSAIQTTASAQDENTSPVVELVRRYGAGLTDVSFVYSSLTQSAFEYTLRSLPNVISLEMVAEDPNATPIRVNTSAGQPLANERPANTKLDAALLRKLTPKTNESGSELTEECLCPKLQTLVCELGDGHKDEAKRCLVDLIEARRSVAKHDGPAAWLEKVDVGFNVGPVDWMVEHLVCGGVDTTGVSFTAKYPDEGSRPCPLSFPIPGVGTLNLTMEVLQAGAIY